MPKHRLRLLPANLKLRLAAVASVLVFVATLLVTLSTLAVAERGMKRVIGDQQYVLLSSAASFMDDRIEARLRELEGLAAGLPRDALDQPQRLRRHLELQAPLWRPEFLNLLLLDPQGRQVMSMRSFGNERTLDARGRAYFDEVVASRRSMMSQPIVSRVSGRQVVIVSTPVVDGARLLGVLTASLDLRETGFLRQLGALKPGGTGYLFLMTADGVMIDHPDKARVLQPAAQPGDAARGLSQGTERALGGFEGWLEARARDGSDAIFAYRRLASTGWILGARYPSAEAFAPLARMRHNAIFGALGLALAAGVLAWVLMVRLLAPLQALRERVAAVRHDGAGIEVLHDGRQDEIGELGRAFHALMAEREAAEASRSASQKRLRMIADNLPVLIAYLDHERRFRYGNATFERWFGIAPARLEGMSIAGLMGVEAAGQTRDCLDRAYGGQDATCELQIRIHGRRIYLQGVFIPDLRPDGSVAGVYALKHDTTHVKEVEEQLTRLARVDTLTGLANRRSFNETLEGALGRAQRSRKPLALAYLDVDHFKRINDSHGHGVGDEVLREFAARLEAGVRATDTPARLSGDEFVVILEDIGGRAEAERIGAKIVDAMRAPFVTGAGPLQVSASVGIALSLPGQDQEGLLAAADSALYAAKGRGRDGYAVYDEAA